MTETQTETRSEPRKQSPDYPGISLAECLERGRALFNRIQGGPASRESVAVGLGYKSLNGASMSAIAAFQKFGLLISSGKELRFSELGLKVFAPHSMDEYVQAVNTAALLPPLFKTLHDVYMNMIPDEGTLRTHLIRRGFLGTAIERVIPAYQGTIRLVNDLGLQYNTPRSAPTAPATSPSESARVGAEPMTAVSASPLGGTVIRPDQKAAIYRRVTMDDDVLEVSARVDIKELRRLIKILQAHETLLEEQEKDKIRGIME